MILYNHNTEMPEQMQTERDLVAFCRIPRSRKEIAAFLGLQSVSYAATQYVLPLVESGKLRLTLPDKPKSTKQKYVAVDS